MAVGKGSMARAAKATAAKTGKQTGKEGLTERKAPAAEAAGKAAPKAAGRRTAKASSAKTVTAEVLSAPSQAVLEQIIYQKSSGMMERDAKPNETFGVGDEMPVYYF